MAKKIETKTTKKIVTPKTEEKAQEKLSFAVVEVTGNQYIVQEGKIYTVKKVQGNKGDKIVNEAVLMIVDGDKVTVGKPFVEGAKVEFEIASQFKGEKIDTFKYEAKSRHRGRTGSRSLLTKLLVKKISTKTK